VNSARDDWAKLLPVLVHSYNSSVHSSTGFSPYFLLYGFHPKGSADFIAPQARYAARPQLSNESAVDFVLDLEDARQRAREAMAIAQAQYAKAYNKSHRAETFEPGDEVLLD
ncbi:hypothetical protein FA95DRAFT_1465817, partial [Auriscalpium vulgare]